MQRKTNVKNKHRGWPVDGLESVPNCPVCGVGVRELLHEGLTDRVFFCAPGAWNMYKCKSCTSAYLDPRPTAKTIGLAYEQYFTHDKAPAFSSLSCWGNLRRRFANGYRNHHYGTQDYPASIFGALVVSLMPSFRANINAGMRHLPKVKKGKRLLDLGCGNGEFLLSARSAGWDIMGVDFDPKAVATACSQGLDIRMGGVESLDPSIEQFDVITLAHVIEHVHSPVEVLQACYNLLKPGGYLWIETPNIASEGYKLFGMNWRGLEPPRHIVLFTLESMRNTLNKVGFTELKVQPYRPLCNGIFGASAAISEGVDPNSDSRRNLSSEMVKKAEEIARYNPERREFITLKAWKK